MGQIGDFFRDPLVQGILTAVGALGVLAAVVLFPVRRLWRRGGGAKPAPEPHRPRGGHSLTLRAGDQAVTLQDVHVAGDLNIYVDRLPQAKPEVREPFEHGQRLQRAEQHEAAIDEFQKALAAADDDSQRCALHILVGRSLWMRRRQREAVEHYRQALDLAHKAQDKEGEAFALGFLAMSYESLGEPDTARAHFDRSLAAFEKMGDRDIQALILAHLAISHLQRAEAREARTLAQRAAALRPLTPGHEDTAFMSLVALAWACQLLDDPREASRAYAEALQMVRVAEDDAPWVATVTEVVPMLRAALERLERQ